MINQRNNHINTIENWYEAWEKRQTDGRVNKLSKNTSVLNLIQNDPYKLKFIYIYI
jgi:hypothetical protein